MRKTCSVDGCASLSHRKGLCSSHSKRFMRHGDFEKRVFIKHGLESDPIYAVWKNMISRCYDPSNKSFKNYGARGVSVCQEWHDISRFNDDVCGHPGVGLTFDRVDVNGNYEPGNVRWTSKSVQAQNRRNNKLDHEKVRSVRAMFSEGASIRCLAPVFGVDRTMISRVVHGRAWKEVD